MDDLQLGAVMVSRPTMIPGGENAAESRMWWLPAMFMLPDPRSASRTRFCRYVPQRLRRGGVRVIAGIVGDVADLSTVTTAHRRGRDQHLHGC